MTYSRKHTKQSSDSISVSELGAYAGSCEMKAYLRYKAKVAVGSKTKESLSGDATHERMAMSAQQYERQRRSQSTDRRCYIATAVYGGDAPETNRLREFRDAHLLTNRAGVIFVGVYYKVSPVLLRFVSKDSMLERVIRKALDIVVRVLGEGSK
jgi:hypothetical protein